jgi:hypothetical protein
VYRALVRLLHPDYSPSLEARTRFIAVQRAYETIRETKGSLDEVTVPLQFLYPTRFAAPIQHSAPATIMDLLIRDQAIFALNVSSGKV